jgi:hypothetical protein
MGKFAFAFAYDSGCANDARFSSLFFSSDLVLRRSALSCFLERAGLLRLRSLDDFGGFFLSTVSACVSLLSRLVSVLCLFLLGRRVADGDAGFYHHQKKSLVFRHSHKTRIALAVGLDEVGAASTWTRSLDGDCGVFDKEKQSGDAGSGSDFDNGSGNAKALPTR